MIKVIEAKKTISWHFYVTRILPVGLFMAMTLAFGNLVYLYLGVAFIQMLKVRGSRSSTHMGHMRRNRRLRRSSPWPVRLRQGWRSRTLNSCSLLWSLHVAWQPRRMGPSTSASWVSLLCFCPN